MIFFIRHEEGINELPALERRVFQNTLRYKCFTQSFQSWGGFHLWAGFCDMNMTFTSLFYHVVGNGVFGKVWDLYGGRGQVWWNTVLLDTD